jgi:hypothetical protein
LSSSWWCSSWSVSVGTFFLDIVFGGIVSYFLAETAVGANVGGPKIRGSPQTQESRTTAHKSRKTRRQRISESCTRLKIVNPFTHALAPPFIGRWRHFYISKLPSNLRNIPNVNMYKNVFYIPWFAGLISYIYKSATSSHFKPALLKWCLWLDFFLTSEALIHENQRSLWFPNHDFTRFPNFADSCFPELH